MPRFAVKAAVLLIGTTHMLFVRAGEFDETQDTSNETIEQIIVTGSRIPRRDFFATSPIVTIDRTELELSGASEIKTLLNDLPQVDPTADAGTGNSFGGESFVNLRGLGSNRTLVLLNSRRYPSQGSNGSVDLNAVPPVLIEKIEVITGGASAVYGSDAMAGAVNFILRKDFSGFESNFQFDVTDRGDAEKYSIDITFGSPIASGRGNVVLFGDYFRRTEVFQDARSFSQSNIVSNDATGELVEFNSFASASSSIAGVGPFYTFEPDGTPRFFVEPDDRFSLSRFTPLLAPMERYSLNAYGRYEMTGETIARFELNYARSLPTQKVADEFFRFVDINVDRPDLTPEFRQLLASDADPDGDGIGTVFLGRTFSPERGPAAVEYTADFWRGLVGLEGEVGNGWHWSADISYASNERDSVAPNDISVSRIQQGLLVDPATGGCTDPSRNCVPVNPFGAGNLSGAAADFITLRGTAFSETSAETFVTATLSGSPFHFSAGDLDLALGAEYRRFHFENSFPNDNLLSGDSLLFTAGVSPTEGTVSVGEAFAEARLPLISDVNWAEYLGLDVGFRVSDYNILDEVVWTWKAGLEWQLVNGLRVRAMRQRAIRVPGMADLFQRVSTTFTDLELGPVYDECSASRDPVGNGLSELCIAQGIPPGQIGVFEAGLFPVAVSIKSNPNAQPEQADTVSAGLVWQPQADGRLSASIDYFRIEIEDALTNANQIDLVRLCFLSRNPNDPFCQTFTRAASGDIDTATATVINSAVATSEGIDFALNLNKDVDGPAIGGGNASIKLSLLATHYLEVGSQGSVFLPFLDCAGKFGAFCGLARYQGAVPDWRTTMRFTYETGPLTASLRWSHVGALSNAEAESRQLNGQPPGVLAVPRISSVNYVDLTLAWQFSDKLSLHLGADNVFDEAPPLLGSAARDANTDPTTYDILGRRYFLRANVGY